ncbi:MYND finger family protein [Phytophthora cinnamomi]|uniref:MYND finger family protein n=1 Tax=Phytophthora cinnamomi TaxID=4785 RepID=UPI003559BADC|nr:MYND finger family protein [Phytophthora cinnamomi]
MGKKTRRQRLAEKPAPAASHAVASDAQHLKLDPRGDGMYSGTFRWLETKAFPQLPPFPSRSVDLSGGWKEYLASRSCPSDHVDLVVTATYDPSMLDALSFPVTLLYAAQLLQLCAGPELRVLVVGASQKAEQRVWRITNYWNELAAFFSKASVTLFFIGPEVDERDADRRKDDLPENLAVRHFRGTFGDFQASQAFSDCTPETSVIVGYNTGFGNFVDSHRHELLFSWLPDLFRIAESRIPAIFTCANDYADMNGEFAVQSRIVGAEMLLLPKQNPFSAASHFHEEGQRDTAWSRGSSFLYVVRGVDKTRRSEITSGDVVALQNRLDADLDMHLQDSLGRHFYKGMVLTKEQASRCKALSGNQSLGQDVPGPQTELETPRYELMPGQHENEVVAAIFVPKIKSASERIVMDLSDSVLVVLVPGKYLLRTKLPFQVDQGDGALKAVLTPPVLRVSFRKTS